MNVLLVLFILCAFGANREVQAPACRAVIVNGQVIAPPFEFSGIEADTLRLNGVPVEPIRGAPLPQFPELTETQVRRWELHFAAGHSLCTSADWNTVVAHAESVYAASGLVEDIEEWSGGLLVHWKGSADVDSVPRWRYFAPSEPPTRERYRRRLICEITTPRDRGALVVMCPGAMTTFRGELLEIAKQILSDDPISQDTTVEYDELIRLRDMVSCWRCGRAMPRGRSTSN
jgi:hypothetical protein